MIYITIKAKDAKECNDAIRAFDHTAKDTFIENKKDNTPNGFCCISVPDNNKPYTLLLKDFLINKKQTKDAILESNNTNIKKLHGITTGIL